MWKESLVVTNSQRMIRSDDQRMQFPQSFMEHMQLIVLVLGPANILFWFNLSTHINLASSSSCFQ